MEFRTPVLIPQAPFGIDPMERMLFVGSCFADNIGRRFQDEKFRATVNPYGVMYNPASIQHTVERWLAETDDENLPRTVVFTLGTNHVYILNSTGEIVDNCQKRPQRLFTERELSVDECADYLSNAIEALRQRLSEVRIVITVSPIRYAKYGFHGSMLSKSTLMLAADRVVNRYAQTDSHQCRVVYFPAYEIVCDELRDYRFYKEDMIHPSSQTVEYIWQRFAETFFTKLTHTFLDEWQPIKRALAHRPFNPESEEYRKFLSEARQREQQLMEKYK